MRGAQGFHRQRTRCRFIVADDNREPRAAGVGFFHLGLETAATAMQYDMESGIAQLFRRCGRNFVRSLALMHHVNVRLQFGHRCLSGFQQQQQALDTKPNKDTIPHVKTLTRDVQSLQDHLNYLTSRLSYLLDATLGLINIDQNNIIKIFSIAAVALMPPTLVGTIYGMNFKNMPELEWSFGYPMALLLMVISAIVPLLIFRWKKWL